jgi:hypothetical protein
LANTAERLPAAQGIGFSSGASASTWTGRLQVPALHLCELQRAADLSDEFVERGGRGVGEDAGDF